MSTIIDGKLVSSSIKEQVAKDVLLIKEKYGKKPKLAVILVGSNEASLIYVHNKEKVCKALNIESKVVILPENATEEEIIKQVDILAIDQSVNGILVQLPLPKQIIKEHVISHIPPEKDVDGLTDYNIARLVKGEEGVFPCTPSGVVDLLKYYSISLEGKRVAVIGRSMLVGKPLSLLLENENATVTVCHSKTTNLTEITKNSDVVIVAVGKPLFFKKEMANPNSVIIDVGVNRVDKKVVGDADYESLKDYVSYISPVPGGVGPMTIAELVKNTIRCFYLQNDKK